MSESPVIEMPEVVLAPPRVDKLACEAAAFQAMFPDLLRQYRGLYVAVHQGKVVGSGEDQAAVAVRAYQDFGYIPILVRRVWDGPLRVVRLPSIRVVREAAG